MKCILQIFGLSVAGVGLIFWGIVFWGIDQVDPDCEGTCECSTLDLVAPGYPNETKWFKGCELYSLEQFNKAESQIKLNLQYGCAICGPLPTNGYFSGSEYTTGPSYTKVWDGECKGGLELRMYEGNSDNPGKTSMERIAACANACSRHDEPLNRVVKSMGDGGPWAGFLLKGFIVQPDSGRCYCENAGSDAEICDRDNDGYSEKYVRYDFDGELAKQHGTCKCIQ